MGSVSSSKGYVMKSATISNTVKLISDASFSWGISDIGNAERAYITPRLAGVMYTLDGTDPTATLGHFIAQNDRLIVDGSKNIKALKFLREASTDVALTITLLK